MENDSRKSENIPLDCSDLLTDWLLKYKLENVSYLSSPSLISATTNKTARKGSLFDSREIIRPTIQLFKNIKSKIKRRNESPSPQRKQKQNVNLSPTKETNKIFNHKASGETLLNAYKKTYTYAKVKHDKVSRDKIESAVLLFRQRELDKETSAKHVPEKTAPRKKLVSKEASSPAQKPVKKLNSNKPMIDGKQCKISKTSKNSNLSSTRRLGGEGEKHSVSDECKGGKGIVVEKHEKNTKCEKKLAPGSSGVAAAVTEVTGKKIGEPEDENIKIEIEKEKNIEMGTSNETEKNIEKGTSNETEKNIERGTSNETEKNIERGTSNETEKNIERGTSSETEKNIERGTSNEIEKNIERGTSNDTRKNIERGTSNETEKNIERGTSKIQLLCKKNLQHSQVGILNSAKDRAALIESLKSKSNSPSLNLTHKVPSTKKLGASDYIIIRPAFIGDNETVDKIKTNKTDKPNQRCVEDLLQEYRIKYRNMIRTK